MQINISPTQKHVFKSAISPNVEKIVFQITTLGGIVILFLGWVNFYFPDIINKFTIGAELYDIWFALYLVVWLFGISLSRLIFFKFDLFWFMLMGLSTAVAFFYLTNKPILFVIFIAGMVIFLLGLFSQSRKVRLRTIVLFGLGIFLLTSTFFGLSDSIRTERSGRTGYNKNVGRYFCGQTGA